MKTKMNRQEWTVLVIAWVVISLAFTCCGCGTHAEITWNPVTESWDIYYHNWRPFAPENWMLEMPGGWRFSMGEQATQNAMTDKLTDAVIVLSGAGGG